MARKRNPPPDQPDPSRAIGPGQPLPVPQGYDAFLRDLKERIRNAQTRAALAVNRELIALYWHVGQSTVERQERDGWGTSVIERLARDVQAAFPGVQGFSRPNVYRMRAFYLAYSRADKVVSQPARQINLTEPPEPMASLPWFHNVLLIEKLKDPAERLWYARIDSSIWLPNADRCLKRMLPHTCS